MKRYEVRRKVSETNKIVIKKLYKEHPELKERIKKATKEAMKRPDIMKKTQKTWFRKGERSSPKTEFKKGFIPWNKGKPWPEEFKKRMSESRKAYAKNNPEFLKRILTFRRPNKTEDMLDSWLRIYFPKEFVFVGNGEVIIEGRNPDWISRNGKKQIIELFGERWHEPEEERLRRDIFAKFGYKTLVIWYEELKDKRSVIGKIQNFIDKK